MECLITLVCQTQPLAVCPRGTLAMHLFSDMLSKSRSCSSVLFTLRHLCDLQNAARTVTQVPAPAL